MEDFTENTSRLADWLIYQGCEKLVCRESAITKADVNWNETFHIKNAYSEESKGGLVLSSQTTILHFTRHKTNSVIIDLWSQPHVQVISAQLLIL